MPGKGDINPATGKQYAVNPATGNWDDNYWALTVEPQLKQKYGVSQAAQSIQNPMDLVKQAQEYQVQQNQPAIATLQGQEKSLQQQYSDLLGSVTQQGNVSIDTATRNQNGFLASRGIYSQGGIGGDIVSNAQAQANTAAGANEAAVQQQGASEINQLAAQVAGLQTGNVPGALGFSSNIAGLQEALAQQQLTNQRPFPSNGPVYDPATGKFINQPIVGAPPTTPVTPSGTNPTPTTPVNPGDNAAAAIIKKQQTPQTSTLNLAPVIAAASQNQNNNQNNNNSSWVGSDIANWWNGIWNPGGILNNNNNYLKLGQ